MGLEQIPRAGREDHWIPLADIMTGLMMMFLLVALVFMIKVRTDELKMQADELKVQADEAKINRIANDYDEMREQIYKDLAYEFRDDLPKWGATLTPDLAIRFKEPDVLFDTGKDLLKPRFVAILDDFFPRYVRILDQPKYQASIEEIRIEGHTSSFWNGSASMENAYFLNMALSQSRTRSTLQYVLSLPAVANNRDWLRAHLTANGLSSSKLIRRSDGGEDPEASQRVEFRVRTNAETQITQITKMLQAGGR
jgi:outer membrane protein OmpA-like peptidoglycan-associated protein